MVMNHMINYVLDRVVPHASLVMLAFAWPTLTFIKSCERVYYHFFAESMDDKVVVITGASSGIGEQIAYEYAKKKANLVLVARRDHRLHGISENARLLGAPDVLIMAADVVKEDDCKRFINETINYFGRVDHLVNTTSLGHTFYFEEANDTSVFPMLMDINFWGNVYPTYAAIPYLRRTRGRIVVNAAVENWLPLPRMSLYSAAKAALVNFYETLRLELNGDVGITIATHGWIGAEMTHGKFMLEEGAEMQWKEEREVEASGSPVEEFAKLIVSAAVQGDANVKFPKWYDVFLLYRVFAPDILTWSFRLLLSPQGMRATSFIGTGKPVSESPSPPRGMYTSSPRIELVE
ncbi:putative 11-beta-hydroxysteroid dehydrogenase [Helianthus annuus]|nr:putative 11-beta-hydroxysteroid dehydrogenase [Helianthus annuus]KAJ0617858.1 putative 11-beta-hydroxysteroid dehydrogenase [Helianthus annuus]KAJ0950772.1 putative 11-beta-hydroxysteroid dehydrogenase [Helianthus annuus]